MAYRVVADHIRTLTFAITDGAEPGATGRNYVIRKICRRGMLFHQHLGGKKGFFHDLVDCVVDTMGEAFPEIRQKKQYVKDTIKEEEKLFAITLRTGEKHFRKEIRKLKAQNITIIPGAVAFKLHGTFGYPKGLTVVKAKGQGMSVDEVGFNAAMEAEKRPRRRKA